MPEELTRYWIGTDGYLYPRHLLEPPPTPTAEMGREYDRYLSTYYWLAHARATVATLEDSPYLLNPRDKPWIEPQPETRPSFGWHWRLARSGA